MAKVLLSFSGNKLSENEKWNIFTFYEGLMRALVRNGNDVYYMIANEFVQSYNQRSNEIHNTLSQEKLDEYVKNQNFDLIIAFNNALYDGYLQKSQIPYIVWGVDPISVYADKDKLKANKSRYIFAGNCEEDKQNIDSYFEINNAVILRMATDVRAEKLKTENNISFVGSLWNSHEKKLVQNGLNPEILSKIIKLLRENTNLTPEEICKKLHIDQDVFKDTSVFWLLHGIATTDRIRVLSGLTDLGLKAYGLSEIWHNIADTNVDLACCYQPELIYDIAATENLYNKSKIGFNMSHVHARESGFSFRLLDIMASNACIVTDDKKIYKELFGKYVKLPTFKYGDEKDARRVCEYLLTHEKERQKIISGCHKAIDAEFRFEHRFKQITDLTGVKLISKKTGSMTQIKADDFIVEQKNIKCCTNKNKKRSLSKRIKDIFAKSKIRRFRAVYKKYFKYNIDSLIGSLSTLGTFVEKRFLNIESKLNNPTFLNPDFTAYHQFLNGQAYIAKVSKGLPPRKPGDKIRVVFMFQEASYWSSLKDLYENLKKDPKFEVFVIAIPVLTVPKLDTLELKQTNIDFLKQNNIDYIDARIANGELFDPYTLKPDYVFVQIHFNRQRPMEYKTNIMGLYTKVCLVPHAFLLSASDNRELIYQTNYFRVFVPNEYHANVLSDVFHHDENIEIVGYPRFDMYKHKIKDSSIWKISRKENPKIKRIIWSPHWWAYGYTPKLVENIFKTWEYFYNFVQNNSDVELIIKPHPNLFNGLVASGFLSEDEKQKMLDDMNNLPNASVYMGGDYIDLFKTADLMVNNSISFLAEWLPSEKPMIFFDTERKFELNEIAEKILDVYYHADNLEKLNDLIKDLLSKKNDKMLNKRLKLLKNLKLITKESVSDTIKKSLVKHVKD